MSTISNAADVDFKFLSSQTCARMSLVTEGTASMILHTSSESLLTVVEPTRRSSQRTTNIHVTRFTSVDLQGQDHQCQKNEMGGACGAYGGGERCAQGSGGET
jgi:hypothetical protein